VCVTEKRVQWADLLGKDTKKKQGGGPNGTLEFWQEAFDELDLLLVCAHHPKKTKERSERKVKSATRDGNIVGPFAGVCKNLNGRKEKK